MGENMDNIIVSQSVPLNGLLVIQDHSQALANQPTSSPSAPIKSILKKDGDTPKKDVGSISISAPETAEKRKTFVREDTKWNFLENYEWDPVAGEMREKKPEEKKSEAEKNPHVGISTTSTSPSEQKPPNKALKLLSHSGSSIAIKKAPQPKGAITPKANQNQRRQSLPAALHKSDIDDDIGLSKEDREKLERLEKTEGCIIL